MQVEHIRLTLVLKALGFNSLKVHPLSKFWFSDVVVNLHHYILEWKWAAKAAAVVAAGGAANAPAKGAGAGGGKSGKGGGKVPGAVGRCGLNTSG